VTTPALPEICGRIAVEEADVQRRVRELGDALSRDFAGEDLRLVTVLKGGLYFIADLCRAVSTDLQLDFLAVAPYAPGHPGFVRVTKDLDDDLAGSSVVLVEDVVDTGLTVNYVLSLLKARGPARLAVCTLLDKPMRRIAHVDIAYCGFELADDFLVGYGLDVDGAYRNLPYVATVRPEVMLGDDR